MDPIGFIGPFEVLSLIAALQRVCRLRCLKAFRESATRHRENDGGDRSGQSEFGFIFDTRIAAVSAKPDIRCPQLLRRGQRVTRIDNRGGAAG